MSKEKPSDGLFMVDCNVCHKLFAVENKLCECGSSKGELHLDIDKMLNRVYELNASNKIDNSIDIVFDVFWELHNKFEIMNSILDKIDLSKLDSNLIVGFLVQTFKYIEEIPNHFSCHNCCGKFNFAAQYENGSLVFEYIQYKGLSLNLDYKTGRTFFDNLNVANKNFNVPLVFKGITADNVIKKLELYNLFCELPNGPYTSQDHLENELDKYRLTRN